MVPVRSDLPHCSVGSKFRISLEYGKKLRLTSNVKRLQGLDTAISRYEEHSASIVAGLHILLDLSGQPEGHPGNGGNF